MLCWPQPGPALPRVSFGPGAAHRALWVSPSPTVTSCEADVMTTALQAREPRRGEETLNNWPRVTQEAGEEASIPTSAVTLPWGTLQSSYRPGAHTCTPMCACKPAHMHTRAVSILATLMKPALFVVHPPPTPSSAAC